MRQDFPDKYKLPNMSFSDALYRWKIGTAPSQEKPVDKGTPPPPPEEQTVYKPILNVAPGDISLPDKSSVALINPSTGKQYPKKYSGEIAKRMIESGRGKIVEDSAVLNLYVGVRDDNTRYQGVVYESPAKPGFKDYLMKQIAGTGRNVRVTLKSGDEVMNLKTNERYPVIIQAPTDKGMDYNLDEVNYIVNGKKYKWSEFVSLFGKSMFDKSTLITTPKGRTLQDRVTRAAANSFIVNSVTKVDSDSSWVSDSTNWMQPAK